MKFLFKKGFEVFNSERYAVANPIVKRDYAETYRLTRRKDGRSFLMKVYLPDEMPEDLKFKGKPSLIAYLNSSGISRQLSIAAWGEFNSPEGKTFPYIITDYFVRGPLSDILLTDGPMNALDAVNVCFDLAGILLNMHTPDGGNFVHCDICPDNIMFGYDENAELHARLIDHDHLRHCGENTAETGEHFWDDVDIRYTAPEAFCSEGIVSNTDVYSLGVILYECYYGAYPWPVDDEDLYEGSSTPRKMGMLMHARNNELPDYRKGDDKWEDMILSLVRLMTEYDYDEAAFTDEIRISMLEAWQRLLAARQTIISDMPASHLLRSYGEAFRSISASNFSGIYDPEGGDADEPCDSPAQKIESSPADDSEFTNAELGYTPLVKMHVPGAGGFKDIAGMDELKEHMQKRLLYFMKNPGLASRYKIDLPNGILLYGPPGCGKSFFAEKFAEESGFNYAFVKASDLGSTWVHGGQGKIGMLFKEARAKSPCIICLDEFDAFAPRRETISNASLSGEVNEFLSQLNNCGRDRVFVIATTNNPRIIDPAMLRSGRIDHCIYIPAPDARARRAVLRLCVEKRPHEDGIDYRMLAAKTEDLVTSDICGIVNDAAMNAAYARVPISQAMLLQAVENWKPTVSRTKLNEYELLRKIMESEDEDETEIPIPVNNKILN